MVKKILQILAYTAVWSVIIWCLIFATGKSVAHREEQHITNLRISISPTGELQSLFSEENVIELLNQNECHPMGKKRDDIDISGIRDLIMTNECVRDCNAWNTYQGIFHITVDTYTPLFRLMVDNRDCYITSEGYVFHCNTGGSCYCDIVTGRYVPPFKSDFKGDLGKLFRGEINPLKKQLETLHNDEKMLKRQVDSLNKKFRERKIARLKKNFMESSKHFEKRKADFAAETDYLCKKLEEELSQKKNTLVQVQNSIKTQRQLVQNTEHAHVQFRKLLDMIKLLKNNEFFKAETVQIVAGTTSVGNITVDFVMRSGNYSLKLGELEGFEQKLQKAKCFLEKTLYKHKLGEMTEVDVSVNGIVITR